MASKSNSPLKKASDFFGISTRDDEYDEFIADEVLEQAEGDEEVALAIESDVVKPLSFSSLNEASVAIPPSPKEISRIITIAPKSYNQAQEIGEAFRDNIPVIMNLSALNDGEAKRMIDFAAGLIFGLRGNIEKVTDRVFLLSPNSVQVSADKPAEKSWF